MFVVDKIKLTKHLLHLLQEPIAV